MLNIMQNLRAWVEAERTGARQRWIEDKERRGGEGFLRAWEVQYRQLEAVIVEMDRLEREAASAGPPCEICDLVRVCETVRECVRIPRTPTTGQSSWASMSTPSAEACDLMERSVAHEAARLERKHTAKAHVPGPGEGGFGGCDSCCYNNGMHTHDKCDPCCRDTYSQWSAGPVAKCPEAEMLREGELWLRSLHRDGSRSPRPRIVCLCGSTRFKEAFFAAGRELTLRGEIVLSVGFFMHSGDPCTPAQKEAADELHLHKIDLCNYVFVLNVGGYIGSSTRREIEYAEKTGKPVEYLEPLHGGGKEKENET